MPATVLPELDIEKLRRFCRERIPDSAQDEVRLEVTVEGKRVSVHERRAPWQGGPGQWTSMPIAQLRYEGDGAWTLYFGDRYGGWTMYFDLDAKQPIDAIIEELSSDPTCVFWG
jgi:LPS sulfotransferase NodH